MADKFNVAATGGTFDEIHIGHMALLSKAFDVGKKVIIGVSSDEFASKRGKKHLNNNFEQRVKNLEKVIRENFGDNAQFAIAKLDTDFGPASISPEVDALVASAETAGKGDMLNKMRVEKGLSPLSIVVVGMVRAEDGLPISSTRIRAGEVNPKGKLLKTR